MFVSVLRSQFFLIKNYVTWEFSEISNGFILPIFKLKKKTNYFRKPVALMELLPVIGQN